MKRYNESVLCFPTSILDGLPSFDRVAKDFYSEVYWEDYIPQEERSIWNACGWSIKYHQEIFNSGRCVFIDRNIAEKYEMLLVSTDENSHFEYYKQIIPYVVLRTTGEGCPTDSEGEESSRYLVYQRGKSGGESRLHDQWSIGVGGHINLDDNPNKDEYDGKNKLVAEWCYKNCIARELNEELGFPHYVWPHQPREIAVINDNTTEVGRVHFGIVSILDLSPAETERFCFEDEAKNPEWKTLDELSSMNLETWSQLLVENIL